MATAGSAVFRFGRRGRDDPADLPIHRWVDDHSLDLLEGPDTTFWGPEPTNWVRDMLLWAEQQAQERSGKAEENAPLVLSDFRNRRTDRVVESGSATGEEADVTYWAYAIREMLKEVHCEVDGIEGAPLFR